MREHRPFWIPYRCLYSRNISNLFMAGRDMSTKHDALGAVRAMRTGGCMGEIVGMARIDVSRLWEVELYGPVTDP
ncbi:MAG TPA: FAD-dependent oxidoreductase [Thermoguttaceae bacterium]|nr:FAD-dependent oxidoreductase [Thermoguttaceae bacterium]